MQLPRKEGRWEGGSKGGWVKKGGNKSRDGGKERGREGGGRSKGVVGEGTRGGVRTEGRARARGGRKR